jgi:hypothetical protein
VPHQIRFLIGFIAILVVAHAGRSEEWQPTETHAVFVGVLEWKSSLTPYSKEHRKDLELRDLLIERGVPAKNIATLLDKEATLANIRGALSRTVKLCPAGSTLIVYYAGHGWNAGDDYFFANYDCEPSTHGTSWSLTELAETLAKDFRGKRVLLLADCCYSGGLEIVVERLAKSGISACNLTSAGTANTSTANWTFTQSIIDGFRGEPLVDANGDGKITLDELAIEVKNAMKHLEGQRNGFTSKGVDGDFMLAKASGPRPTGSAKFPVGCYVETNARSRDRYGRVVRVDGDQCVVQFYDYCVKRTARFSAAKLTVSTRETIKQTEALDVGVKPDCDVLWDQSWYPAKVMKKEKDRWYIHYVGYEKSWDEWVEKDRIRFPERK